MTDLAYEVAGSGDPVLFIAGTGGAGRTWHIHQVPAFVAAGYRCITFDNRGIGATENTGGFSTVQMLADTIKFLFIFALLLVILWGIGYPPNLSYLALPVVFSVTLLFAAGVGFLVAAIVPLIPDLRFVIEQVLTVVMFLSGVVFALDSVPSPLREVIALNPVATLLDATRGILMHAQWPDWPALLKVCIISAIVFAIGIGVVRQLAPRYPKLAV